MSFASLLAQSDSHPAGTALGRKNLHEETDGNCLRVDVKSCPERTSFSREGFSTGLARQIPVSSLATQAPTDVQELVVACAGEDPGVKVPVLTGDALAFQQTASSLVEDVATHPALLDGKTVGSESNPQASGFLQEIGDDAGARFGKTGSKAAPKLQAGGQTKTAERGRETRNADKSAPKDSTDGMTCVPGQLGAVVPPQAVSVVEIRATPSGKIAGQQTGSIVISVSALPPEPQASGPVTPLPPPHVMEQAQAAAAESQIAREDVEDTQPRNVAALDATTLVRGAKPLQTEKERGSEKSKSASTREIPAQVDADGSNRADTSQAAGNTMGTADVAPREGGHAVTTFSNAIARTDDHAIVDFSAAQQASATHVEHAGGRPHLEVHIDDASLGSLRVQATVDGSGGVHVGIAGQREESHTALEQLAPLLHAAMAQQAEAHGGTAATMHVLDAADRGHTAAAGAVWAVREEGSAMSSGLGSGASSQNGYQAFAQSGSRQGANDEPAGGYPRKAGPEIGRSVHAASPNVGLAHLRTSVRAPYMGGLSVRI